MNFLKSLGRTVLTLLLFLALGVFSTLFALNSTLLDPDFLIKQVDRLDITALAQEMTQEQVGGELPLEAVLVEEALYAAIAENEPWLKEQVNAAIYSGYDYLLGRSERLNLVISIAPIKEDLRDNLWRLFQQNLESLPPELATAPPGMLEQYFEQFYQQFAAEIPSEFALDESSIPPNIMAQLNLVRENLSYAQTLYRALIGLMVLLVVGIVLLHRSVKGATRELGVTFLIYGALDYASVWATQNLLPGLPLPNIPPSLQAWLNGLISDLVSPMGTLGIGLMAGGAVLILVSVIYPRLRPEGEAE